MSALSLDNNVALPVADHLRLVGHTVVTARELGTWRAGDEEHLWLSAQRGWTFVTHDDEHFALLHRAWRLWRVARAHAGIIVVPQTTPWTPNRIALELERLLAGNPQLTDRLYRWKNDGGWRHDP